MTMNGSRSAFCEDNQWKIYIEEKSEPAEGCCIYKVPKKLRQIKKEAYTPQLISIGPFHYQLPDKKKQKMRYRKAFVERIKKENFEKLEIYVKKHAQRIRDCYSEEFHFPDQDPFLQIILDDAVFIIELFLRNYQGEEYKSDFLLHQQWLKNAIKLDLQLLENQLPYFVLKELYVLAFGNPHSKGLPSFLSLSCKFFDYDEAETEIVEGEWKHFLDLRRYAMVKFRPEPKQSEPRRREGSIEEGNTKEDSSEEDLPFAVMLNEAGLRFKALPISKPGDRLRLLGIKFEKAKGRIPFYKRLELQIPRIVIEDCTECLMRNLMALEQCHYPSETHICNYVALIDSLVNTRKDVDLLFEKGIISNRVGDHTAISDMFNKLCLQITTSESCYNDIIKALQAYHKRWLNRTKATLKSVYFRDIWRGTATAAAALILLLTVLQTMQRLWRGWTPPPP